LYRRENWKKEKVYDCAGDEDGWKGIDGISLDFCAEETSVTEICDLYAQESHVETKAQNGDCDRDGRRCRPQVQAFDNHGKDGGEHYNYGMMGYSAMIVG